MSRKKEEPATEMDFENSMSELEAIVEALENDSLSLAEMITRYERGSHLLNHWRAGARTTGGISAPRNCAPPGGA